jgi:hypothetical protein
MDTRLPPIAMCMELALFMKAVTGVNLISSVGRMKPRRPTLKLHLSQ